ncbi:MAG: asparaginase [Phycisphaeraceae bacterium]|nr:asparaginase [Phycisphaeraceae bacterium]
MPTPVQRHVAVLTTGGTIEKTYDEYTGALANHKSIVRRKLARLRLTDTQVTVRELMSKDSLDLTDDDRRAILQAVRETLAHDPAPTGIVILHGTDTLSVTGELLKQELSGLNIPVVLTGAMRPFAMQRSDGVQNLTEAIFATGVLSPGVWCVFHGRALAFPGVVKDRGRGTFTSI